MALRFVSGIRMLIDPGGGVPLPLRDRRVGDGRSSGSVGGGVGTPPGTGGGTTPPAFSGTPD